MESQNSCKMPWIKKKKVMIIKGIYKNNNDEI